MCGDKGGKGGGLQAVWRRWAAGCLDRLTRWRSGRRSSSFLSVCGGLAGLGGLALVLLLGLCKVTDREDKWSSLTPGCCSVNLMMALMAMGLVGPTLVPLSR